MADHAHIADHGHLEEIGRPSAPLTPDAFIADRQRFWVSFTRFVVTCTAGVVILLLLLALFLL